MLLELLLLPDAFSSTFLLVFLDILLGRESAVFLLSGSEDLFFPCWLDLERDLTLFLKAEPSGEEEDSLRPLLYLEDLIGDLERRFGGVFDLHLLLD